MRRRALAPKYCRKGPRPIPCRVPSAMHTHLREGTDIPSVEHDGYRCRQYLGALAAQGRVTTEQVERGIYVAILEGRIEFGYASRFVNAGGDARSRLNSAVRIQGVSRSRVVVVEVPLGFAQNLM